jgi:choloylglycine hydrolase
METGDGKTISWISKYGSITFNQYGREFPTGGMNEKGLVG